MHLAEEDQARTWLGALIRIANTDGGPTGEQRRILDALAVGFFRIEGIEGIDPLEEEAVLAVVQDAAARHRLLQLMVVLELCRHPGNAATAAAVERFARWAEVDEPMLLVARDAIDDARQFVLADYKRFTDHGESPPPELVGTPPAQVPNKLRELARCAPGTVGWTILDFYEQYGFDLPGSVPGPPGYDAAEHVNIMVKHDFSHVLAGYTPNNGVEELALNMMLVRASEDGYHHFCNLMGSLSLHETGIFESSMEVAKSSSLSRPGASEVFAEALRRGAECPVDFWDIDHFSIADEPLEEARAKLGIPPRVVPPAPVV